MRGDPSQGRLGDVGERFQFLGGFGTHGELLAVEIFDEGGDALGIDRGDGTQACFEQDNRLAGSNGQTPDGAIGFGRVGVCQVAPQRFQ